LLSAFEEFDHLGVRFVSVQDQVDTENPMGRAMFTIIGAMAELESSLISERVIAGMRAAEARGEHLGRPPTPQHIVSEIVALATSTDLSIRQIQARIARRASRSMVGEITKRARVTAPASLVTTFYTYPEPRPTPWTFAGMTSCFHSAVLHDGRPSSLQLRSCGPVASIIPVSNEDEAVAVANDSVFGLGGGVITRDLMRGQGIAAELIESGSVFVNEHVRSTSSIRRHQGERPRP
jgi:hypothetical protein